MHKCNSLPSEIQTFELSADDKLGGPSSLVYKTWHPWLPKRISSFDSSDQRRVFHFTSDRVTFGPEKTAAFLDCVHIWLLLCMIQLELAFLDYMVNCVQRQLFLEVFLSPCSDVLTCHVTQYSGRLSASWMLFCFAGLIQLLKSVAWNCCCQRRFNKYWLKGFTYFYFSTFNI